MIARERSEEARAGSYDALIDAAHNAIVHHKLEIGDRNVRSALRIDATRPEAHNLLGVLREIAGDRFEAQQCYRKALETDPGYAPALANLRESVEPDRKTSFFLDEAKIGGAPK
jgi:Flp pilus assembly protein TadD